MGTYCFLLLLMVSVMGILAALSAKFFVQEIPDWRQEWKYLTGRDLLNMHQVGILEKYHPYYQFLSAQYKLEFQKRVSVFCGKREFKAK